MTTRTKTLLLLCGFALCLAACAAPRYSRWYESPRGLDLSGGYWLVVPVETALPLADKEALTRLLAGSLRSMRGDSVDLLGEVALKYLSPAKFAAELRPELLETLRKTTTYDYVVTARVTVPRSDMGALGAIPGVWQKNEAEAILLVYDVSSGARVYCQRVTAVVSVDEGDGDVWFAASGRKLACKALKKALGGLRRGSILP